MARILVIDDDDEIRPMIREILARAGHEVREASRGAEAIEIVEDYRPDVVITDILMPEMDGVETIIHIRCSHPDAKIVAISGGNECLDAGLCLRVGETAGATVLLRKPIDRWELLKAVDDLVAG